MKRSNILLIVFVCSLIILKTSGKWDAIRYTYFGDSNNEVQASSQPSTSEPVQVETPPETNEASPVQESQQDLTSQYTQAFYKYYKESDYQSAVYYGEMLSQVFVPDISFYRCLGYAYYKLKNYEKASFYYQRVLSFRESTENDREILDSVNHVYQRDTLNNSINNVRVTDRAPSEIYNMIVTNLSPEVKEQLKGILDVVWSVPEGRTMLDAISKSHIPLHVEDVEETARVENVRNRKGVLPEKIVVPLKYIKIVNDSTNSPIHRIYGFTTFMHEFGHAYFGIKNPQCLNSLEEEIGVSMIGYNIAYKIILNRYLNASEAKNYSREVLSVLTDDGHKNLQVYNNFNILMPSYGINLPYPEFYSNIPSMYKQLRSEGKMGNIPTLDAMIK